MYNDARAAYLGNAVATASPARLLVMLYDRLTLDLQRALEAQQRGDHVAARPLLLHAQDIVVELRSTLRVDVWQGGPKLAAIYDWLYATLVRANTGRDADLTADCLRVISPLTDTWREAALTTAVSGVSAAIPAAS